MNIRQIEGHSVDLDLITDGWVVDLGAGPGFEFSTYFSNNGNKVLAVEPNIFNHNPDIKFDIEHCAIGGTHRARVDYILSTNPEANTIVKTNGVTGRSIVVECKTISQVFGKYGIKIADCVKIDIEGSEYDVLAKWPGPISKQITIEFHDFRRMNPHYPDDQKYYTETFRYLSKWYNVIRHDYHQESVPSGAFNNMDTLLVLRNKS